GCLVLLRIRYDGFERFDRLIPVGVLEDESAALDEASTSWLLDHRPKDRSEINPVINLEELLQDAIDELVFLEQEQVGLPEQQRFERNLEQVESYVEDQLLVLRRRLTAAKATLRSSENQRDKALGSDARSEAERKVRNTQSQIDDLEAQI